jgi:hypothetical protein
MIDQPDPNQVQPRPGPSPVWGSPPAGPSPAWGAPSPAPAPFASASALARATMILLGVTGALGALATLTELRELQFLADPARDFYTDREIVASRFQHLVSVAVLRSVPLLATGVVFLAWIYRAARNLPALGARTPRFSPGWAVGWFLVPVMHLFRPYEVVKEIWAASGPPEHAGGGAARGTRLLGWWWALWVLTTALGGYVFAPFVPSFVFGAAHRSAYGLVSLDGQAQVGSVAMLTYTLVYLATVALAIAVVHGVDRRHAAESGRSQP